MAKKTKSGSDTGVVIFTCSAPLVACDGTCVDVTADAAHCGACGAACAAADGRASRAQNPSGSLSMSRTSPKRTASEASAGRTEPVPMLGRTTCPAGSAAMSAPNTSSRSAVVALRARRSAARESSSRLGAGAANGRA